MMVLFTLIQPAEAVVTRTLNICVDYDVMFSDAPNTSGVDGLGDFWDNNTIDRAGIGLEWEVVTTVNTYSGRLNTAGCMTATVQLLNFGSDFDFAVYSNTSRRGIDLLFRFNDDPNNDGNYFWEEGTEQRFEWTNLPLAAGGGTTQHDVLLPAEDGWQFLAVATWLIHRNNWNLSSSNTRGCCTGSTTDLDGTCSSTAAYGYKRLIDPYKPLDPKVFIQGREDTTTNPNGCCGSKVKSSTAPPNQGGLISGFDGGVDEQGRYTLAHELGHVLAGIRMGGWEWGQYPHTAPLDDCNGTRVQDGTKFPLLDSDKFPTRGTVTKEFMGVSAREGWADWVSAWAWNSKNGADCEFTVFTYQDFDLDGDVDNYFGSGDPMNGAIGCVRKPEVLVADPSDPTDSFVGEDNWLEEVLLEGVCDPNNTCGANASVMESRNRSTIYDWQRMLYNLYKTEGLSPQQISDIYVNMCPRQWRPDDGTCTDEDDLPLERLNLSGLHLQHDDHIDDQIYRVEH